MLARVCTYKSVGQIACGVQAFGEAATQVEELDGAFAGGTSRRPGGTDAR